jgi:hypothetical protein
MNRIPILLLWMSCLPALLLPQTATVTTPHKGSDLVGIRDFDFEIGNWTVHHRVRRADGHWVEFDGTCTNRPLMAGAANVEEHVFSRPTGVTRGLALRAYDPNTGLWAIWWVDGRDPHGTLDPPVKGRFEKGVGTFYSDGLVDGKPTRTRFLWSRITPTSARWEQAYSADAGKTWETNWVMGFQRAK